MLASGPDHRHAAPGRLVGCLDLLVEFCCMLPSYSSPRQGGGRWRDAMTVPVVCFDRSHTVGLVWVVWGFTLLVCLLIRTEVACSYLLQIQKLNSSCLFRSTQRRTWVLSVQTASPTFTWRRPQIRMRRTDSSRVREGGSSWVGQGERVFQEDQGKLFFILQGRSGFFQRSDSVIACDVSAIHSLSLLGPCLYVVELREERGVVGRGGRVMREVHTKACVSTASRVAGVLKRRRLDCSIPARGLVPVLVVCVTRAFQSKAAISRSSVFRGGNN